MIRTNPVIFRTNYVIFRTNQVTFRTIPVIYRTNLVIKMSCTPDLRAYLKYYRNFMSRVNC